MPLHPQVKWQATLKTLGGSQTLFVLWSLKPDIRRASERDLVLRSGSSGRSGLEMDQVYWGIAWEKGDSRIIDEQAERHFFHQWVSNFKRFTQTLLTYKIYAIWLVEKSTVLTILYFWSQHYTLWQKNPTIFDFEGTKK